MYKNPLGDSSRQYKKLEFKLHVHTFNPSNWETETGGFFQLETSPVYSVSSKLASCVFKEKKKKKKHLELKGGKAEASYSQTESAVTIFASKSSSLNYFFQTQNFDVSII